MPVATRAPTFEVWARTGAGVWEHQDVSYAPVTDSGSSSAQVYPERLKIVRVWPVDVGFGGHSQRGRDRRDLARVAQSVDEQVDHAPTVRGLRTQNLSQATTGRSDRVQRVRQSFCYGHAP